MKGVHAAGSPPSLSFVGAGRAATALAVGARAAGYEIAAVSARHSEHAWRLAHLVGARAATAAATAAQAADITIIAVPDRAITGVAATVAASGAALGGRALVHTAARLGADALAATRLTGASIGVLHPLQALAGRESAGLLSGSYFRLEAAEPLRGHLEALVSALGGRVLHVPAEAREAYHAAAVLAGNAPLTLLAAAERALQDAGVDASTAHSALAALLHGTATNALRTDARSALTGPIARGDAEAVAAHLHTLSHDRSLRDLYLALARETSRLAGRDPRELGLEPDAEPAAHVRRVA